jgi:two-component system cell cycle response regulator
LEVLRTAIGLTVEPKSSQLKSHKIDHFSSIRTFAAKSLHFIRTQSQGLLGYRIRAMTSTEPMPKDPPFQPGDIDLLEKMLCEPASVRDVALNLIEQHWGNKGVGWVEQLDQIPAGHQSVSVELAGQSLGHLHIEQSIDSAKLKSWANWWAHWLALQQRLLRLEEMAMHDELTGAWNRRYFNQFLKMAVDCANAQGFGVTLLMLDLDNFKSYNDRFGHSAGDQILQETAKLMQSLVREHDVVARIGGDEFAVIFWDAEQPRKTNSQHPVDVRAITERFQNAIHQQKFPKLGDDAGGNLTVSGGLASFPRDGHAIEQLIEIADQRLLDSKRQGKNVITFGPASKPEDLQRDQGS